MTNKNKDNSGKQTNNKNKDSLKENFDWEEPVKLVSYGYLLFLVLFIYQVY